MTPPRVSQSSALDTPSARPGWAERLLALVGKTPTTQGQFYVAWFLWGGTGLCYFIAALMGKKWEPAYSWLGALLLLSGVSTAHFVGKRLTDTGYVATKQGNVPPEPGNETPPEGQP